MNLILILISILFCTQLDSNERNKLNFIFIFYGFCVNFVYLVFVYLCTFFSFLGATYSSLYMAKVPQVK